MNAFASDVLYLDFDNRRWHVHAFSPMGSMMRFVAIFLSLLLISGAQAASSPDTPGPSVHDLSSVFVNSYDATSTSPISERIHALKQAMNQQFPGFYGIERFNGNLSEAELDGRMRKALSEFDAIRNDYIEKARQFSARYQADLVSFKQAFPGFQMTLPVYLVHSLGEMDGGPRSFNGQTYLVFGLDAMVRYHKGFRSESTFFHHELFHIYHGSFFNSCAELWCRLWTEGLAVHVSRTLNPDANDAEALLDFPPGLHSRTLAALPEALHDLQPKLDSSDPAVISEIANTGPETGRLPRRRAYVIGWLIARELGQTRSLDELARLPDAQVRPLIDSAIHALLNKHENMKHD
ncbi:hypothetical protein KSF73_01010 [Burkholderiaceae bacterium DAT-1]|nr:hypothetical protein [Burkholderiaceae bacterium DAT-1]